MGVVRAAIIENGVAVNITKAKPEFAKEKGWVISDKAKKGDLYDGSSFTTPDRTVTAQEIGIKELEDKRISARRPGKNPSQLTPQESDAMLEVLFKEHGLV